MSLRKGNKNAEKWTEKKTLEMLDKALHYVRSDNEVISLADIMDHLDYYPDLWAYLTDKFKDNHLVFRAIKRVESRLESNIIKAGAYDKAGAMAIFLLKNKFGYADRIETDHTTKGESINIISLGQGKKPK